MVQVKGNQPELHHAVQHVAAQAEPCDAPFVSYEHEARSRIEYRKVTVFNPKENTLPKRWRTHLQAVIEVQRWTETFQTQTGTWQKRQDIAFYVADYQASARAFAHVIRDHWGVENRLHYVRDVTLGEDASRIRRNPGIFARLRTFALNILRRNRVTNVAAALYENALDFDRVLAYQGVF